MSQDALDTCDLLQHLAGVSSYQRVIIAYSGGRDSHVLLDLAVCAHQAGKIAQLSAVHINHGLHPTADNWASHCQSICDHYGIALRIIAVAVPAQGLGVEAHAREARYDAIAAHLQPHDVVCTAHHQRDQVETLLLQLCRGAGLAGLSSMPIQRSLGCGYLLRPLLPIAEKAIADYAADKQLCYIDDPSNQDNQRDRNYIRHEIIPRLVQRWPKAEHSISRSIAYMSQHLVWEHAEVVNDLATVCHDGDQLSIEALEQLPTPRQTACLRYWFKQQTGKPLNIRQLYALQHNIINAAADRQPQLVVDGRVITRYRNYLHLIDPMDAVSDTILDWDISTVLNLPCHMGTLSARLTRGEGIAKHWFDSKTTQIRFRQGGEKCKQHGRRVSRPLKKILQEAGVPPWQRDRIPLLYLDDELVAVLDYWISERFLACANEMGITINHRYA